MTSTRRTAVLLFAASLAAAVVLLGLPVRALAGPPPCVWPGPPPPLSADSVGCGTWHSLPLNGPTFYLHERSGRMVIGGTSKYWIDFYVPPLFARGADASVVPPEWVWVEWVRIWDKSHETRCYFRDWYPTDQGDSCAQQHVSALSSGVGVELCFLYRPANKPPVWKRSGGQTGDAPGPGSSPGGTAPKCDDLPVPTG